MSHLWNVPDWVWPVLFWSVVVIGLSAAVLWVLIELAKDDEFASVDDFGEYLDNVSTTGKRGA